MTVSKDQLKTVLLQEMEGIAPPSPEFLFSPQKNGYHDLKTIRERFFQDWSALESRLTGKAIKDLQEIILPAKPYDLKILEKINRLTLLMPAESPLTILDLSIARILKEIISDHYPQVTPQLFIELLKTYHTRPPEFLLLSTILIKIILSRHPSVKQGVRTQACAVLINNYDIESLIIYISGNPHLGEEHKQTLFQSLMAFQKIYRKILELQEEIGDKDLISLKWFGVDFEQLKKRGEFRDSFSNLVGSFVDHLKNKNKKDALNIGRYLVLRFNNEDILRILYTKLQKENLHDNVLLKNFIYRQIYTIMQEFRGEYISQKVDVQLTRVIADIEAQALDSMRLVTVGKVPARIILKGLPKEIRDQSAIERDPALIPKLEQYHLTALFDLYPVAPEAQKVLLTASRIGEDLELKKEELGRFIYYLEKLLMFLQQLEEMGIKIKISRYGLVVNPFQLNSLGLIQEGAYFASTGYWLRSRIPPSLIRCISPRALPNCLGHPERHIFSRISLLTGGFRGAPFDLDSTNRYDWDEDPETCQIRPGYFLVDIPRLLGEQWEKTQAIQKQALHERIEKKQWG